MIADMIIAIIKISRPVNVVITFLTIIVAAEIAGGLEPVESVLHAAVSASLIKIGANVINDYFDISIDKINKPQRPLVKRTVLWGNLTVSLATAMAFIYAGMAVGHFEAALIPAGFAFLFHFGREVLKDMEDIKGDKQAGAMTFPIKYGIPNSNRLTRVVFILLVILTLIPYIFDIYGLNYFLMVCIGVYPVLIYVVYRSQKDPSPKNLSFMSNLLKADMLIGLIAIYLK
jgi:geranylgeranylglycerol-phosphate geranylgeranyltransferase